MSKILKITPIKGNCITNVQIKNQEAKIRKAMQLLVQNSSTSTPIQRSRQIEQINRANVQLFDSNFLNPKQYEKQIRKYLAAIEKIGNQESEDINRFTANV